MKNKSGNPDSINNSLAHPEKTLDNETLQATTCLGHIDREHAKLQTKIIDDSGWQQSTPTVAQGGLGLSSAVNVSLPAYASSLSATRQLVGQILQDVF